MAFTVTTRPAAFQWDQPTGLVAFAAALLCLVPTVGFLLAWHMQLDLGGFARWGVLPAVALLGLCEAYLVHKSPLLFNRLISGLLGGLAATAVFDAVRLPLAYAVKGVPDFVPMIGQYLIGETIGIAPTAQALALGYGFHYLLVGGMLGAAYSLLIGKGRWQWSLASGLVAGVAFAALPQFRLLAVATGFDLGTACAGIVAAFALGGLTLGRVVEWLGRTTANILHVVFLREHPVEAREELLV